MLVLAIAEFFRQKLVGSIFILSCSMCAFDQIKLIRQMSEYGMKATFVCDLKDLNNVVNYGFQGVLYLNKEDNGFLEKTQREHFARWYKWLVVGDKLPKFFNNIRYDADMTYVKTNQSYKFAKESGKPVYFEDVFINPSKEASLHPWGYWVESTGLNVTHGSDRITRRLNLKKYPLKIVSPVGHYSPVTYNGHFSDYLKDSANPQLDSAIRCAYLTSSLIIEALNASEVLLATQIWSSLNSNESMLRMVETGVADITGAILRILPFRVEIMDYILPIWPFGVGFTYLAERESSSNMYVEPFSAGVWWCCLGITIILAILQRITARQPMEKEGAYFGVLATWLQQDASAVPEGISGRWSFMVMSISAMLVHAYYTSAIVSALMSAGRGGPETLRALGDSKYAIASEDVEYMRYLFWDTKTNWSDLEYLKKKKMTSKFYLDMKKGVDLIGEGSLAYHTEYNQIYPHFKTFSDDKLCKLQYVDTIPEQLSWTTATKRSQYTDIFRSRGAWLHETGLAHRVVSRLRMRPPPCRASLLAERVKFGDVALLLATTTLGAIFSLIVLGLEIMLRRIMGKKEEVCRKRASVAIETDVDDRPRVLDVENEFVN